MFVGILTVELHVFDSGSLKSKRSVVKGMKDRIRSRFNVSVAEVDNQDLWQRATLGVACVSGDKSHAVDVLNKVMDLVRSNTSAELIDYSIEVI
ncbi:MAG TPA: DUF503 domain-containing protein [Nitrospirota bacterium]|nr:DUF503 domain-containing protein [Nitrospirota bacterium]